MIRDRKNNFVILAHADRMMNIFDRNTGLFVKLNSEMNKFKLTNDDIEIYFEHGASEYVNQQDLFDYRKYIEMYFNEFKINYDIEVLGLDREKNDVVLPTQQYIINENQDKFIHLFFDVRHEKETGEANRRGIFYNMLTTQIKNGINGCRADKHSILNIILSCKHHFNYSLLNKPPVLEVERARYRTQGNNNRKKLHDRCLCGKYIKEIREYLITKIPKCQVKINNSFVCEDYVFPPISIYDGSIYNVKNKDIELDRIVIPKKIAEYLTHTKTIIDNINPEDIKLMLDKSVLELSMRAIFETTYNGISVNNNYFYNFVINKVNDDRIKNAIDGAINNIELKQQIQQNQPQPQQLLVYNAGITPKQTTINEAKKNITDLQKDKKEIKDRANNGQQIIQPRQ